LSEIEQLLKDIDKLKDNIHQLINKRDGNLIDHEVVATSKTLDTSLNSYNKMIEEKISK
jgi:hypothetical protein